MIPGAIGQQGQTTCAVETHVPGDTSTRTLGLATIGQLAAATATTGYTKLLARCPQTVQASFRRIQGVAG
jgi:hypothetical protein